MILLSSLDVARGDNRKVTEKYSMGHVLLVRETQWAPVLNYLMDTQME